MTTFIPFEEGEKHLDWIALTDAFEAGHKLAKAEIADTFLYRDKDTLLNRSAWITGLGLAVKAASVFPGNPAKGVPMIHGAVNLFDDATGDLDAVLDFHLVTKWKTAGDSLLGARKLARPDSHSILILGAGTVGRNLHQAYSALFPDAQFSLWNRTAATGEKMADDLGISWAPDLETAMGDADIITSATMSTEPFIRGDWLQPGTHLDMIGAYRPDMREADDVALQRARVFVDSFDTTIDHIGELKIPLASGAITRADVLADFYSMEAMTRQSDEEITLFKNGGGAHLDLMTSRYILDSWNAK